MYILVLFWPDLATCHYKKENLDFLRDNGIAFVEKAENPPNAPQIRPIENYWGILKMKLLNLIVWIICNPILSENQI